MKFTEARKKLAEMAPGKFRSLSFEITEYAQGNIETECYLYVDPQISSRAPTWDRAFEMLSEKLGLTPKGPEEIPDVDDREVAA